MSETKCGRSRILRNSFDWEELWTRKAYQFSSRCLANFFFYRKIRRCYCVSVVLSARNHERLSLRGLTLWKMKKTEDGRAAPIKRQPISIVRIDNNSGMVYGLHHKILRKPQVVLSSSFSIHFFLLLLSFFLSFLFILLSRFAPKKRS